MVEHDFLRQEVTVTVDRSISPVVPAQSRTCARGFFKCSLVRFAVALEIPPLVEGASCAFNVSLRAAQGLKSRSNADRKS